MTLTTERIVNFGFCVEEEKTRELDQHGRCSCCGSDAVIIRPGIKQSGSVTEIR
jgi:hypothetical protein